MSSPVDSSGMDWTGLESTGIHLDYVGEGKDLLLEGGFAVTSARQMLEVGFLHASISVWCK